MLGRGGCSSGQIVVKEAAVSTRGRLLHGTTDWRLLCRPISSIPAVRQLSAGKSVGRSDLRLARQRGEEGGKLREQRLRAESAQVVRRSALGRRPTRAGESARTRWSCRGGSAPAKSPGQFILSARESTLDKRRRRYRRAGVHTENAWKQTRRQRVGVAGRKTSERSENTRGVAGRAASTGRVVSGIEEECRRPWERKVYPSVLGVGWSVKARWTRRIGTFTASHVG